MSTLSFPSNPSPNDTYTFGGKTWVYNGSAWDLQSTGAINDIAIGNVTPSTGAFTTLSSTGNTTLGDIAGDLVPAANLTYSLGNASNQWANIYVGGNTIFLGNLQLKDSGSNTLAVYGADGTTPGSVSGTASLAQYVTQAAQGNITSVGTLTSLSVSGNSGFGGATPDAYVALNASGTTNGIFGNAGNITIWNLTRNANNGLAVDAFGDITFVTNSTSGSKTGTQRMIINNSGNVGIANTSPNHTLAVTGTGYFSGAVTFSNNIENGQANGVGNIGSSSTYFNTVFAKATSAQYADLAEIYTADADYPAGTVVAFGGSAEITQSLYYAQTSVAGVVSTNPAYVMNAGAPGLPVALQGRVPCRVTGTIRKGDLVAASDTAGVATKLDPQDWRPGSVIGKALGDHDGDAEGVIEVVVGRV